MLPKDALAEITSARRYGYQVPTYYRKEGKMFMCSCWASASGRGELVHLRKTKGPQHGRTGSLASLPFAKIHRRGRFVRAIIQAAQTAAMGMLVCLSTGLLAGESAGGKSAEPAEGTPPRPASADQAASITLLPMPATGGAESVLCEQSAAACAQPLCETAHRQHKPPGLAPAAAPSGPKRDGGPIERNFTLAQLRAKRLGQ